MKFGELRISLRLAGDGRMTEILDLMPDMALAQCLFCGQAKDPAAPRSRLAVPDRAGAGDRLL
jgi:hypothetical protein